MNDVAALIADMVRAGVDPDIIGRTAAALTAREPVKVVDEQAERRRAKDRERKRLRNSAESVESAELAPPKEKSPTPPKEITPSTFSEPSGSSNESAREFADFWSMFPNKVGKRDAARAFASARKRAPFDEIMAGLRRYLAKTDDRAWCNPATFLNQDRWEDQPADNPTRNATAPPRRESPIDAYDEIARERGWTSDESEVLPSHNSDAKRLPEQWGEHQGVVVDLRPNAYRRV